MHETVGEFTRTFVHRAYSSEEPKENQGVAFSVCLPPLANSQVTVGTGLLSSWPHKSYPEKSQVDHRERQILQHLPEGL